MYATLFNLEKSIKKLPDIDNSVDMIVENYEPNTDDEWN